MSESVSNDRAAHEDEELRQSLADLSGLVAGPGQDGLEAMLTSVAEFAVRAIPGADGAGLTLLQDDRPDTIVASAPFVREVDTIQYGLGEGPCITAVAEAHTVRSGSLAGDRSWPRFGSRIGDIGVHSALSLPLLRPDGVLGSVNVYARAHDAFDDRAQRLGELYAVPAAISVQNGQALSQARRLVGQLKLALVSRAVIDQARGILMARTGCSADEAFDKLRAISQAENRKTSAVARSVVDQAVRRARVRGVE